MPNLVGDLFHIVHVVDEIDTAEAWYDVTFSPTYMFRRHESHLDQRTASLMLIGEFPIEPMSAFSNEAGRNGSIGRFRSRFGQRLHSIAFYSDEVAAAYERFRSRGIRVVGDGGATLTGPPDRGAIYTHPRDTYGLIELMEPRRAGLGGAPVGDILGDCYDPRLLGTHDPGWWSRAHPLGLSRLSHLTVLVDDLDAGVGLYMDVLDAEPFHESHGGIDSVFMFVGSSTVIELQRPRSGTEEWIGLVRDGGMLWSVTFLVGSLNRAIGHLSKIGTAIEMEPHRVAIPVSVAHGARYYFTDVPIPGDPRDCRPAEEC